MKKEYISPTLVCLMMSGRESLMAASGEPTQLIDNETAGGNESLSRRRSRKVWDDEEVEEDEEYENGF